jgi:hypothetical protein
MSSPLNQSELSPDANEAPFYLFDGAGATRCCRGLIGIVFWHKVSATRTNFQLAHLAFGIESFHSQAEFVHPAIVFFVFSQRKPEAVSRGEIPKNLRQTGAIVTHSADMNSFTAAVLCQAFCASGKADSGPAD